MGIRNVDYQHFSTDKQGQGVLAFPLALRTEILRFRTVAGSHNTNHFADLEAVHARHQNFAMK